MKQQHTYLLGKTQTKKHNNSRWHKVVEWNYIQQGK